MRLAGIILCGGHSTRMGAPKATLPFGPETMLARMARIVSSAADPIVVVAAAGQALPALAAPAHVVTDAEADRGPLEGLLAGMRALVGEADAAFVTGCDLPLLVPGFITRLAELLGDAEAALPSVDERPSPLPAIYRLSVLPQIEALLCAGQLRLGALSERVVTRLVTAAELRAADPELVSLRNVNSPAEYLAALKAGFTAPDVVG